MESRKVTRRKSIRKRIRRSIKGASGRPRLSVFRSNKGIYAQLINDIDGKTIAAASSMEKSFEKSGNKVAQAAQVGKLIAERGVAAGITEIVFDRGGYLYHGRVKALADGAREGGLKF